MVQLVSSVLREKKLVSQTGKVLYTTLMTNYEQKMSTVVFQLQYYDSIKK